MTSYYVVYFLSQESLCCFICLWCQQTFCIARFLILSVPRCQAAARSIISQKLLFCQSQERFLCKSLYCTVNTIQLLNRPKGLLRRSWNCLIHLSFPFWRKQFWCSKHQHLYSPQRAAFFWTKESMMLARWIIWRQFCCCYVTLVQWQTLYAGVILLIHLLLACSFVLSCSANLSFASNNSLHDLSFS